MSQHPKHYDPATKAAVMAALLAGQGIQEVAKQYKIPEGTIKAWKSRQKDASQVAAVAAGKKEEIGELLLAYLRTNLSTLQQQQIVFADADWLRKQDAGEVAVLHGVLTDKAIRLLEALSHADVAPQG